MSAPAPRPCRRHLPTVNRPEVCANCGLHRDAHATTADAARGPALPAEFFAADGPDDLPPARHER
jgi:hypothetical protein